MRLPSQPFAHQGGVVLLAHRGFSGHYPENTMLAFEKAAGLPVDGLEMDIHATRDGVLVVSHDESVARMTGAEGLIKTYTLAELKQLDAGYTFSPDGGETHPFRAQGLTIPTFEEVLARFDDLWINVDIKQHEPRVVDKFCALIHKYDAVERLCVGSFSSETVSQFREACPAVVSLASLPEIAWLFGLSRVGLGSLYRGGGHPIQVSPQDTRMGITFDVATPRFLAAAHGHEMAVHLWTINEKEEMRRFVDMGVDGIITDYPNRALDVLDRHAA